MAPVCNTCGRVNISRGASGEGQESERESELKATGERLAQEIEMSESNDFKAKILASELVRAVGAAFYPDSAQVVFDLLLRFSYLRGDHLHKQLGVSGPAFQGALEELVKEGLVAKAEFNVDEKGHAKPFYFLNFRQFLDVVSFRVFKMQRKVKERYNKARQEPRWQCPNCHTSYDALTIMKYQKDGQFYCPQCSLVAGRLATPVFLQQADASEDQRRFGEQETKLEQQLRGEEGLRPSLYDLLQRVRALEAHLPSDLPDETERYREEFKLNTRRSPVPEPARPAAGDDFSGAGPLPSTSLFARSAIFAPVAPATATAPTANPNASALPVSTSGSVSVSATPGDRPMSAVSAMSAVAKASQPSQAELQDNDEDEDEDEDVEWED